MNVFVEPREYTKITKGCDVEIEKNLANGKIVGHALFPDRFSLPERTIDGQALNLLKYSFLGKTIYTEDIYAMHHILDPKGNLSVVVFFFSLRKRGKWVRRSIWGKNQRLKKARIAFNGLYDQFILPRELAHNN